MSLFKPFLQQQRKAEALQSAAKNVAAEFNPAHLGTVTAPELFLPQAPSETFALKAPPGSQPRHQFAGGCRLLVPGAQASPHHGDRALFR